MYLLARAKLRTPSPDATNEIVPVATVSVYSDKLSKILINDDTNLIIKHYSGAGKNEVVCVIYDVGRKPSVFVYIICVSANASREVKAS